TPAAAAGLRSGDRVLAVNGHRVRTFEAVSREVRASHGRPITVTVERGGQRAQISGPVGIVRSSQEALQIGFNWYLQLLGLISMSLALLNLLPLLPLD